MSFALFFPGQGSQSLKMLDGFAESAVVKTTFEEASEVLKQDLWALVHGDDAAPLNDTVNTQPVMLAAGVAVWRAFQEKGGAKPAALAGHSLGEYSALVASGSLNFADAVRLVRLRAELMQTAVPQGQGAMAAVLGLDDAVLTQVCAEVEAQCGQNAVVEAVNFNSPGQTVIAGHTAAVERALAAAKAAGAKRAVLLPVSVPSHCRLMRPAAEQLRAALADTPFRQPEIRVLHNADVAAHAEPEAIKDALVRQLYSPVLWTQTVSCLVDEGITESGECGPGKVLAGLAKRIRPEAVCTALVSQQAVAEFAAAHPA